jgi:hypothetical protein
MREKWDWTCAPPIVGHMCASCASYHLPFQILVNPLPDVIPPPDHILSSVAFGTEQPRMGLLVFVPHPIVAAEELELGGHPVIWLQQSDRRCLARVKPTPKAEVVATIYRGRWPPWLSSTSP